MSTRPGLRSSTRILARNEAEKKEDEIPENSPNKTSVSTENSEKNEVKKEQSTEQNDEIDAIEHKELIESKQTDQTSDPASPPGYVPPLLRKLSPETILLLNKPVSSASVASPVDFQLAKIVGLMLADQNLAYSQEFLSEITDLSIIYFHDIIDSLRKFTELQRRRKPSIGDTRLLLRTKGLPPLHLYEQYIKSKQFGKRKQLEVINKQTDHILQELDTSNYQLDKEDPSLPFFANEHYEITQLVPKSSEKPIYIPEEFPDLPPDYTYENTGEYMELIDDLKEIRLKLVEESRMTDSSLYNLIENDDRIWKKNFELELAKENIDILESDEESIISANGQDKNATDVETPVNVIDEKVPDTGDETAPVLIEASTEKPEVVEVTKAPKGDGKAFDFVEYAKKRKAIIERRQQAIEKKRKLRQENIFMMAEKKYSPYATAVATEEDDKFFRDTVSQEFKTLIKAVRVAEDKKQRQIARILERKSKQAEKDKGDQIEFGFSFNANANIDDSESEEEDVANLQFIGEPKKTLVEDEKVLADDEKAQADNNQLDADKTQEDKKVHFEEPEHVEVEEPKEEPVPEQVNAEELAGALMGEMEELDELDSDDFADLEDAIETETAQVLQPDPESDEDIE